MVHNLIFSKYLKLFLSEAQIVDTWWPNGYNSIRITLGNQSQIVFTWHGKDHWCLETLDNYMKRIKKLILKRRMENEITSNLECIDEKMGRVGLLAQKHSPEILLGVGVVGIIGSTIWACKSTLKIQSVIEDSKENLDKIKYAQDNLDKATYSEQDAMKDKVIVYKDATLEFLKLYGPPILIGAASIGCIIGSHGIMRKRNFALVAAYKAIEQSFKDYRKRVAAEFGEDKDRMLKNGVTQTKVSVMEMDEKGKAKKNR